MQTTQEVCNVVAVFGWILVVVSILIFVWYVERSGLLNVGLPQARKFGSVKEMARVWPGHSVDRYIKHVVGPMLASLFAAAFFIGYAMNPYTNEGLTWLPVVPYALVVVLGVIGLIYVRSGEQRDKPVQPT